MENPGFCWREGVESSVYGLIGPRLVFVESSVFGLMGPLLVFITLAARSLVPPSADMSSFTAGRCLSAFDFASCRSFCHSFLRGVASQWLGHSLHLWAAIHVIWSRRPNGGEREWATVR